MSPPRLLPPSSPSPAPPDLPGLLRTLAADPRPRLTWYGPGDQRVELTGRVLVTWVAKTAHLLADEADVAAGSLVRVGLPGDWRAPVFWLATRYLGADLLPTRGRRPDGAPDVDVVGQDQVPADAATGPAVVVVVPRAAVPAPTPGLPPGCVDYGGEVSGFPDTLPAPGPSRPLAPVGTAPGRVLVGPDATADEVLAVWTGGGSVVMHAGLPAQALRRVVEQENVERSTS